MNNLVKLFGRMLQFFFKNYIFYFAIINLDNGQVDTNTNMSAATELYYLKQAYDRKKPKE